MTDPRNPYRPPTAHVADHADRPDPQGDDIFIPNGRIVPAGRGAGWIGDAWRLFRARPGKWLLTLLVLIVIYVVASWIPLSSLVTAFFWPFISAGIAKGADLQRRTGNFDVGKLFDGYEKQWKPLLLIGAMGLLALAAFFVLLVIMMGVGVAMQAVLNIGGRADPSQFLSTGYALAILIYLAIVLPITAATYLAPPLIVLNNLPAGAAMKMSFFASFKNVLSGLVYGLCALGLGILAIIPLGLGMFVWLPVMMITLYTAYRDIFIEQR